MKRFLTLLLALTLCLSLCACGGSDTAEATPTPAPTAEPTPTPVPETPAEKYHKQMLSVLEGGERGTVTTAKAVTLWTDDRGVSTYKAVLLSNKWMARGPEEVKYIVHRTETFEVVGHYSGVSNGIEHTADACVRIVDIAIVNSMSGEVLSENSFRGGEPPQAIMNAEDRFGDYPDERMIADWVNSTLDELNAGAKDAALEQIRFYLEIGGYSKTDLLERLTTEDGFTTEEAQYALDNCGAEWDRVTMNLAKDRLERYPTLSRNSLIEDLISYNMLSEDEAAAAADSIDWNAQALAAAYFLLNEENGNGYSPETLYSWLLHELGFAEEQVQYALDNVKTNWNEQAAKSAHIAIEYWYMQEDRYGELNQDSLTQYLVEWEGFTEEQAAYGAKKAGIK